MKSALYRFKFLGLLILAFLIFVPTLVFAINTQSEGYQILRNTAKLEISPAGYSTFYCISNNSSKDYFIPTRTKGEFDSFEAHLPQWVSCEVCCDKDPAGIYIAAQYFAGSQCEFYWCGLDPYNSGDAIQEGSVGGSCGLFKKWRHTRCASLYSPSWGAYYPTCMHQGDSCVTAAVRQSDWAQIRFCYGTYDYLLKKCMYTGSTLQTVDAYGYADFRTDENYYRINWVGVPTWGTCSSAAPCGDTICSTAYGETCASCPPDCGVCPCGNYNCDPGETCSSCPTDCGVCPCYDYYDQYSCESASCYWHSYGYVCGDYPCSYYYDYECSSVGCIWNSYNYSCVNSCSEIYDQYACGSAGCYWDGYSCY